MEKRRHYCGEIRTRLSDPTAPAWAMQALAAVRLVTFRLEGQPERRKLAGGCPEDRLFLKALKLVDQRSSAPTEGEDMVM